MRKVLSDIKCYLEKFREIYGVETAILSQKDGFPINIVGVWLSENEIFVFVLQVLQFMLQLNS